VSTTLDRRVDRQERRLRFGDEERTASILELVFERQIDIGARGIRSEDTGKAELQARAAGQGVDGLFGDVESQKRIARFGIGGDVRFAPGEAGERAEPERFPSKSQPTRKAAP